MRFQQVPFQQRADINIRFESLDHGDGNPFDGRGKTIGHAYYPISGDAHFDDDEPWQITSNKLGRKAKYELKVSEKNVCLKLYYLYTVAELQVGPGFLSRVLTGLGPGSGLRLKIL